MKNIVIRLSINMKPLFIITILCTLFGCSSDDTTSEETQNATQSTPNILFIIADDLGKDALNGFPEGSIKPNTPHIDAIRNAGLSFNNFWSYPTCSPTRASILTGKYGYRTDVKWAGDVIQNSETSLQQYISNQTNTSYATAVVGKWHLAGNSSTFNPEVFGIDYYAGLLRGEPQSYYNWLLTEDGSSTLQTDYSTTAFTDLSINWIQQQNKPWFMWLAYNAPHTPFHVPPSNMHMQGNLPEYANGMDETPYYMAAIEAMDYQIGRLLDTLSETEKANTTIIFIGDNGTPNEVVQTPYLSTTAKGTLYQGGINVPLFISGHGVTRTGIDPNLITSTDLFATIAQLAGVGTDQINDSKSFKSLLTENTTIRDFQYAEKDDGNVNNWTINNGNFKLITYANGAQEFYNLNNDAYETSNLLNITLTTEQANAKASLETELSTIRN